MALNINVRMWEGMGKYTGFVGVVAWGGAVDFAPLWLDVAGVFWWVVWDKLRLVRIVMWIGLWGGGLGLHPRLVDFALAGLFMAGFWAVMAGGIAGALWTSRDLSLPCTALWMCGLIDGALGFCSLGMVWIPPYVD
jgi:hypothetical protein